MIYLFTGAPGSGKTLSMIDKIMFDEEFKNRPVYQNGIRGLKKELGWIDLAEEDFKDIFENRSREEIKSWNPYQPNAIICIDEVQTFFPPQATTAQIYGFAQWLQTHRHHGVDVMMTTQNPSLIDAKIKAVISNHIYLERAKYKNVLKPSVVYVWRSEWNKFNASYSSRAERKHGNVSRNPLPSRSFEFYESAEIHTAKNKFNPIQKTIAAALVGVVAASVFLYTKSQIFYEEVYSGGAVEDAMATATHRNLDPTTAIGGTVPAPYSSDSTVNRRGSDDTDFISVLAKLDNITDRLEQNDKLLAHISMLSKHKKDPFEEITAPVYQNKVKIRNPEPFGGCLQSGTRCICMTTSGKLLPVTYEQCTARMHNPNRFNSVYEYPEQKSVTYEYKGQKRTVQNPNLRNKSGKKAPTSVSYSVRDSGNYNHIGDS